jgi:antitoxin (DNA-binding transcriptional repressor) of toxin-antitoxin stability system
MNIHEAKTLLSKFLDRAIAGEELVIMHSGKPLVLLIPVETPPPPRMLGTAKGEFVVPDDFNEPLPDDVLIQF